MYCFAFASFSSSVTAGTLGAGFVPGLIAVVAIVAIIGYIMKGRGVDNIVAITDNESGNWGGSLHGIDILAPEKVAFMMVEILK